MLGKYRGAFVKMRIGAESIALDLSGTIVASRLIEGKYPDCNSVIPRETGEVASFNPKVAAAAMKRAGIVTDEKSKSIVMNFKANRCDVTAARHDAGAFKGAFDCAVSTAAEVAFNGAFFLEMVRLFDESKPIRAMSKPGSTTAPFLFDQTGEGTFLLMPIKLAEVPVAPPE
jgi:DNA polymerase-3 subunit beta